ncbi:hypothetical protein C8T65DRAFT_284726 [Cerioporus squamosus]|nr:hypothetical protein C8T65DRAFT_284726 [Cerioporus squamosus]
MAPVAFRIFFFWFVFGYRVVDAVAVDLFWSLLSAFRIPVPPPSPRFSYVRGLRAFYRLLGSTVVAFRTNRTRRLRSLPSPSPVHTHISRFRLLSIHTHTHPNIHSRTHI